MTHSATHIAELIEPTLTGMGYELVLVRFLGGSRVTLQVMAEPLDRTRAMTLEDCSEISTAVSALLDVKDPVETAYALEVSSPGIERPLVKLADFQRFVGYEARLESNEAIDGRKRFQGIIERADETGVEVAMDTGQLACVPLQSLKKARLVLSDRLLSEAAAKADAAEIPELREA